MALLNRKIDYALLILCYLHRKVDGGCAREIAAQFEISKPFVANILKDLCQKGFVLSLRGVKGGYQLLPSTPRQSLADLIDALDDTLQLAECNSRDAEDCCAHASLCPIREPIQEVHLRIRAVLESVKLFEIFRSADVTTVQLDLTRCASQSSSSEGSD